MLSASRKHVQRHPAWLSGALRISTNLRAVQRNQESPAETECPEPSFIGRQTGAGEPFPRGPMGWITTTYELAVLAEQMPMCMCNLPRASINSEEKDKNETSKFAAQTECSRMVGHLCLGGRITQRLARGGAAAIARIHQPGSDGTALICFAAN